MEEVGEDFGRFFVTVVGIVVVVDVGGGWFAFVLGHTAGLGCGDLGVYVHRRSGSERRETTREEEVSRSCIKCLLY